MRKLFKYRQHILLATLLCTGCAEAFIGVDPPDDARFYYPGRMTVSDDQSTVYIVNTNFDQQFTAGWISVLDVDTLMGAVASGTDLNAAVDPSLKLSVPTLGGQLVLDPNRHRAYLPSRSNGLLTTVDIDSNNHLSCGDRTNKTGLTNVLRRTDCDNAHFFKFMEAPNKPPNVPLSSYFLNNYGDPIAATLIPGGTGTPDTLLAVGFLSQSLVLVMDPTPASGPTLQRAINLGNTAVLSMTAGLQPGSLIAANHVAQGTFDRGFLYFIDVAASLTSGSDVIAPYSLNADMGGFELSSLALNRDQNQLYVASNAPDALVSISLGIPGMYSKQVLSDATAVDSSRPTSVLYLPRVSGDLIVMTSVPQDTLYFFSQEGGRLLLVQRVYLPQGQGPSDVVRVTRGGKDYLLVSTFFDHGLSVVDITSSNTSEFSVVGSLHQGDLGIAPRTR